MTKGQTLTIALLTMLLCTILTGFFISALSSKNYPLQRHVAFLFVGKDMDADSVKLEDQISNYFTEKRDRAGIIQKDLPVVSYHFNRKEERTACESNFNIKIEDLPFLGIVELDDKEIPEKVLYRQNKILRADDSLSSLFEAGVTILKSGKVEAGENKE